MASPSATSDRTSCSRSSSATPALSVEIATLEPTHPVPMIPIRTAFGMTTSSRYPAAHQGDNRAIVRGDDRAGDIGPREFAAGNPSSRRAYYVTVLSVQPRVPSLTGRLALCTGLAVLAWAYYAYEW